MAIKTRRVKTSRFSVVYVEPACATCDSDRLTVLVYDADEGLVKSFQEVRLTETARVSDDGALHRDMVQFRQSCLDTMLVAYDLMATRLFLQGLCAAAGVEYPFRDGYEVDVKSLVHARLRQVDSGPRGLRNAAERLGLRRIPSDVSPSWGAITTWYMLKRIVGI